MAGEYLFQMRPVDGRGHYIWTTRTSAADARRRNRQARIRGASWRWVQVREDCQDEPGNVSPLTTGARPGRTGRLSSHTAVEQNRSPGAAR